MDIDRKLFLEKNEGELLFKFSAPAVLGMLAIAACTITDSILVGKLIGTLALAATTLSLPVFMIFSAISNTLGVGGASIWSVDMGARNFERAQKVFGNVIFLNLFLNISICILGLTFIDSILHFFQTPPDVYPLAKTFMSIQFVSCIFIIFTISINNFIRAEGKPVTSMCIILLAVGLIIVLDIIFIYFMKMGITGAALSALFGHMTAFTIILLHFTIGNSKLKLKKEMFVLDFSIMKEIIAIGAASFLRQFSIAVMHFITNVSVVWYAGLEAGVVLAIVGIGFRLIMFILMPVIGVIQGMQPIIGFNFGAKNYIRARKTVLIAMISSSCIASIGWLIGMINPEFVLKLFSNDPNVINNGENIIRFMVCIMPFVAAQTTGAGLFQVLKKPAPACFFAALRQIILLVPIILLLPKFFGINGVWYSIPIADFSAFLITAIWIYKEIKWLEKSHRENNSN